MNQRFLSVQNVSKSVISRIAMLKNHLEFFRQFHQQFETTGAITPSSYALCKAISKPLASREPGRPVRVLEVGPGTGSATKQIVSLLQPGDTFDLVEVNETFVAMLEKRFETDDAWSRVAEFSHVHCCYLQDFETNEPYDYIISGLPLNNFPADLVSEFFQCFYKLLKPTGTLSYFEYMYIREALKIVSRDDERDRLKALDKITDNYINQYRFKRNWIFLNVPPAWVQHLKAEA